MPTRTKEHELADRGLTAVARIWNAVGFSAERVIIDYGEDLAVQTHCHGRVDPYRLWIQVKGLSHLPRSNKLSVFKHRFKVDHLTKWKSFLEPFYICVYDDRSGRVYLVDPGQQATLWHLYMTKNKSVSITFNKADQLTPDEALSVAWQARQDHHAKRLALVSAQVGLVQDLPGTHFEQQVSSLRNDLLLIPFDFLRSLGIIRSSTLHPRFLSSVRNAAGKFSQWHRQDPDFDALFDGVFLLAVLGFRRDRPFSWWRNLAEACAALSREVYREWYPRKWNELVKLWNRPAGD